MYTPVAAQAAKEAFEASGKFKFKPESFIGLLAIPTKEPSYGKVRCDSDENGTLFQGGDVAIHVVALYEGRMIFSEVGRERGTLRVSGGGYFLSSDSKYSEAVFM